MDDYHDMFKDFRHAIEHQHHRINNILNQLNENILVSDYTIKKQVIVDQIAEMVTQYIGLQNMIWSKLDKHGLLNIYFMT